MDQSKLTQHQKNIISKITGDKDDIELELEKQEKLFDVEINERNSKIDHLEGMVDKYKKVIDKVDTNIKQIIHHKLPQEFNMKIMAVEKKLKREKDAKNKLQDELRACRREMLEKETQYKRQVAQTKNQELKAFGEWDLNKYQTNQENFRNSAFN